MVNDERDRPRPDRHGHDGWNNAATYFDLFQATGVDVRSDSEIRERRRIRESHEAWVAAKLEAEQAEAKAKAERERERKQKGFAERHNVALGLFLAFLSVMIALWGEISKIFTGAPHHG